MSLSKKFAVGIVATGAAAFLLNEARYKAAPTGYICLADNDTVRAYDPHDNNTFAEVDVTSFDKNGEPVKGDAIYPDSEDPIKNITVRHGFTLSASNCYFTSDGKYQPWPLNKPAPIVWTVPRVQPPSIVTVAPD